MKNPRSVRNFLRNHRLQFFYGILQSYLVILLTLGFSWVSTRYMMLNSARAQMMDWRLWAMIGLFASITTIIVAGISIVISWRIAGPLYAIEKHIDLLLSGDYSRPLSLRKSDEFKDLADKLNQLREKLSAKK